MSSDNFTMDQTESLEHASENDSLINEMEALIQRRERKTNPQIVGQVLHWFVFSIVLSILEFGSLLLFSYLLFLKGGLVLGTCGILYRCGCNFKGAENCNAFDPHITDPHHKCPWCVAPKSSAWLVTYGAVVFCSLITFTLSRFVFNGMALLLFIRRQVPKKSKIRRFFHRYYQFRYSYAGFAPSKYSFSGPNMKKNKFSIIGILEFIAYGCIVIAERIILHFFVFLTYAVVLALIFKWASGYEYFLFFKHPPRHQTH